MSACAVWEGPTRMSSGRRSTSGALHLEAKLGTLCPAYSELAAGSVFSVGIEPAASSRPQMVCPIWEVILSTASISSPPPHPPGSICAGLQDSEYGWVLGCQIRNQA